MRCLHCNFDNPEGMKFCGACGTPLTLRCPQCKTENPPQAKFCGACAAPLTERRQDRQQHKSAPSPSLPTAGETAQGERRQLTVMFCDLVGSTPLAARLDPEELRELIRHYQQACAGVIERFGGYIAQYLGDGLLVYFGYPQAHEDDAQRAVRAGLGIASEVPRLSAQETGDHGTALQVRIGIHTGEVVVSEMGSGAQRELIAFGETPNVAARLQGMAAPGTVVVSAVTQQLIRGFFECQDLGAQRLRGIATPVTVYRVVRESGISSRFAAATTAGLTPLVGREQEVGLLQERWEHAREGAGQVVLLSGDPGIGKSRLLRALKEHLATETSTQLEFFCLPHYQNSALYPVINCLQRLLQFRREDAPEDKLTKLELGLQGYRLPLEEAVPLLASLLSLPHPPHYPPLDLNPQKQKQRTQETLVAWLVEVAERQTVLAAWEDLQWADPSTLELLSLFINQAPMARTLTLLTFRPEFSPPWSTRSYLTHVTLGRLAPKQVEVMVKGVVGEKALPTAVMQQIVSRTDGVPLFVEEFTKMMLESALLQEREDHYELTGPLPPLAIPVSLQDSLMARLDRLGAAKEVAQLGATLGREFSYELLQAVSPLDETKLRQGLDQLVQAELLYQKRLPPQATYFFKHTLIQDTAYQSLLRSNRQQYHRQIAQVLQERFAETVETQPELLAHHYTQASLTKQAIPYWQRAGRRAVERSAHAEAISHLTKGLELLHTLPETEERMQQELALQIALGGPLIATKGYGAPEVERVYGRALALCRHIGETPRLLQVLLGLDAFYFMCGNLDTARQLGEQCVRLAQPTGDPARILQAQWALGQVLSHIGEFALAHAHLQQANVLYDPRQHNRRGLQDFGVTSLSYTAAMLWFLGYPDQALAKSREALALARTLAHAFSETYALIYTAVIHQFRREPEAALPHVEAAMACSVEQNFPVWLAYGTILRGWALAAQEPTPLIIAQMHRGLAAWRATGAEASWPLILTLLAEAHGQCGQYEQGLELLTEALAIAHKNNERYYEAELYRLKGVFTLHKETSDWGLETGPSSSHTSRLRPRPSRDAEQEAEECFLHAIEIAHRQQAKSLELRAVTSLCRLWQQQGRRTEAHQMLANLYAWFTEGFDTVDLRAAKALLDELALSPFGS